MMKKKKLKKEMQPGSRMHPQMRRDPDADRGGRGREKRMCKCGTWDVVADVCVLMMVCNDLFKSSICPPLKKKRLEAAAKAAGCPVIEKAKGKARQSPSTSVSQSSTNYGTSCFHACTGHLYPIVLCPYCYHTGTIKNNYHNNCQSAKALSAAWRFLRIYSY